MTRFPRFCRAAAATALSALALASLPASMPTASADEVFPRPASGVVTVIGGGFGHGRGMSQYGSMAAATAGRTWQEIIAFYYPNTTLKTGYTGTIRVGVSSTTGMTARVAVETGLVATSGAGTKVTLPATIGGVTVSSWQVGLPSSSVNKGAALWARLSNGTRKEYKISTSSSWTFTAPDSTLRAMTSTGSKVANYSSQFRGVRIGSSIQPVVIASLETYTRQVVPWENFASWPVTAQAAQAVAARSYGAWYMEHPRATTYDICDTTACQVFRGLTAETPNTLAGVKASAGNVVAVGGSPVRAEFGSSNGGQIVGTDLDFQVAKPDRWEPLLTPSTYMWRANLTASRIQSTWPSIGTFTSIVVTSRDGLGLWGGRVLSMRVQGKSGSVTVTGNSFKSAFGLRSNYFTIANPDALVRDQSGDGGSDVLSRASDGRLLSTQSTSATTFGDPVAIGNTSWATYSHVFAAGHFGSDRFADVLSVDASGTLRHHPSYGDAFGPSTVLGTGFAGYNAFVTLDDFAGTGHSDIIARRTSDGAVVRFKGNGTGGLVSTTPTVITPTGWNGTDYNQWFGSGDITGDGYSDLLVRRSNGDVYAWKGNGSGGFSGQQKMATGWGWFKYLTSPGDVNKDGLSDMVGRYYDGRTRLISVRTATGWASFIPLATAAAGERLVS